MSRAKDSKFIVESQKIFLTLKKVGWIVFIACVFVFLFVEIRGYSNESSKEKKVSTEVSTPRGVIKVVAPSEGYSTEEIRVGRSIYWNALEEKGLGVMFKKNGMVVWVFKQSPTNRVHISSGNMRRLQGATIHFRSLSSKDQPVYVCTTRRACAM
ncbi:MAG: hypothetical protein NUV49_00540 [Patescibacteria group bacterium]|nr:hypothetical protein [Patescibacteria group bacterium]